MRLCLPVAGSIFMIYTQTRCAGVLHHGGIVGALYVGLHHAARFSGVACSCHGLVRRDHRRLQSTFFLAIRAAMTISVIGVLVCFRADRVDTQRLRTNIYFAMDRRHRTAPAVIGAVSLYLNFVN